MNYIPNINEPRVQKRIKKALGFVGACIKEDKPHAWSTRYLDKHLGRNDNNLGNWLRSNLLICTNERYSMDSGICKQYIKNKTGYDELVSFMKSTAISPSVLQVNNLIKDWVQDEYKDELKNKEFTYKDKSSRLWHPLQNVRKEQKLIVFSENGLKYQYDIECCAPTLIYQYSKQIPEILNGDTYVQGPNEEYLPAMLKYISNRYEVRQQLANDAEISVDLAKEIINALLNGAKLSSHSDSAIYQLLGGDVARIEYLKQNEFIKQLKLDIKTCWDYIKHTLPKTMIVDKNKRTRTKPISSKQKAGVYFDLERQVLNSVITYLSNTNNKHFLEHDGWVCINEIDTEELIKWVKNSTGFDIKLDRNILL